MNNLAFSPLLALSLVAATGILIFLLHLLRPRALQRTISSTVLWAEIIKAHRKHHVPWRWLLSLLLCLLIGLALTYALTQPQGIGFERSRVIVLLDNSPSMGARTRDGETRWQHALLRARDLISSTGADIMLADTMGQAPITGFVRPAQALEALDQFRHVAYGPVRMPALPSVDNIETHLIGDGVAEYEVPAETLVHSVFEPADNVAITGLQTRVFPTDPLRMEAFVQVYNASTKSKRVRLTLRGGDNFSVSQDLEMASGELIDAAFDVTDFSDGVLAAAAITSDDALPRDDIAFAMVAPHRARDILLVSEPNQRLEDSLRALPGVRLSRVTPDAYRPEALADVYIFNGFAPPDAPQRGALLFQPAPVSWLPQERRATSAPLIRNWERGHVLLAGVGWHSLRIGQASLMTDLPAGVDELVTTQNGALIASGVQNARWIVAGFNPEDSNFPLQPGFPIFLGNALNWLTETEAVLSSETGTIQVPIANARIVDGAGEIVASHSIPGATVFDAVQPDVYTARSDNRRIRVVANVRDPRDADINASRFDDARVDAARISGSSRIELWFALVLIAMLVLLVEWVTYLRRVST